MPETQIKNQDHPLEFKKDYDEIMKKAQEICKSQQNTPTYFNVNENFKKFSLYTDPNSVTSFNTNASL